MSKYCKLIVLVWLLGIPFFVNAQSVNDLLGKIENSHTPEEKLSIYKQLAYTYQKKEAYAKSSEYLQKAYSLETNLAEKVMLQEAIGWNELALKKYSKSLQAFEEAYQLTEKQGNPQRNALEIMVNIAKKQGNYAQAISYSEKLLELDRKAGNGWQTAQTLNNLGVLCQVNGQNQEAQKHFQEALNLNQNLYQKDKKSLTTEQSRQILNNMATLSNYLGNYDQAMTYIEKAEIIPTKKGKSVAITKNLKAITYHLQGQTDKAQDEIEKAIEIAETEHAKIIQAESYQILSEIQTAKDNFQEAQNSLKKSTEIQEEITHEENERQKALLDKQIEIEKRENQTLQLIAENKRKALELEQAQLETEKKAQALELQKQQLVVLERDKELQTLAQEQVQQALALAEAQLQEQKREKQINALEQEKQVQALELEKQKLKEVENEKERKILQQEKQLKDQQLAQQKEGEYYKNLMLLGASFLLIVILVAFLQNRKQNKKLVEQNQQITEQSKEVEKARQKVLVTNDELLVINEELQQTQEEIVAQRDVLARNNEELGDYKYRIGQSIKSAKLIQNSILPVVALFEKNFADYFILYLPKDVVSGDFYWLHQVSPTKKVLIEVDCTGHGVPGAFMTLIGHAIINQAILTEQKETPIEIMKSIDIQVKRALQQESTGNLNGMDLSVLVLEKAEENPKTWEVIFGASGQKLYYFEPEGTLQSIKGGKRKIGGSHLKGRFKNREFQEETLVLSEGTTLFLSSDGFIDQNDSKRHKFGTKKFEKLLCNLRNLTLSEQKTKLQEALADHQKNEQQRDDITVIGVQL